MKILLPIDRSNFSEEALKTVVSLVRPKRHQVHVLHVIEHGSVYLSADIVPHRVKETVQMKRDEQAEARALVDRAATKLRRAGLAATGIVESGDAKSVILDYAGKWGADLIVIGSHGLKGLSRVLMGSVSDAVVQKARCSVQVVRMPAGRAQGKRRPRAGR